MAYRYEWLSTECKNSIVICLFAKAILKIQFLRLQTNAFCLRAFNCFPPRSAFTMKINYKTRANEGRNSLTVCPFQHAEHCGVRRWERERVQQLRPISSSPTFGFIRHHRRAGERSNGETQRERQQQGEINKRKRGYGVGERYPNKEAKE